MDKWFMQNQWLFLIFMKCGGFIFSVLPVRVLYNITLFCVRVADFYGEKVQFEKKKKDGDDF